MFTHHISLQDHSSTFCVSRTSQSFCSPFASARPVKQNCAQDGSRKENSQLQELNKYCSRKLPGLITEWYWPYLQLTVIRNIKGHLFCIVFQVHSCMVCTYGSHYNWTLAWKSAFMLMSIMCHGCIMWPCTSHYISDSMLRQQNGDNSGPPCKTGEGNIYIYCPMHCNTHSQRERDSALLHYFVIA